jgi:hypothetical protein
MAHTLDFRSQSLKVAIVTMCGKSKPVLVGRNADRHGERAEPESPSESAQQRRRGLPRDDQCHKHV